MKSIFIRGACQHNLKNITVEIPRNEMTVVTGLSGSGKSTLAFDTLYAEGQRRYVESLSAYARQFLERMQKPEVESIDGLSPAIAIEQRTSATNPRSTVGTTTEIYDFLRLLFARIGIPHCPKCKRKVSRQSIPEMVDATLKYPKGTRLQVLAPLSRGEDRDYRSMIEKARREGFVRVRINGKTRELSGRISLLQTKKYQIDVVVDRLVIDDESPGRIHDSLEIALRMGEGIATIEIIDQPDPDLSFTELNTCPECDISFPDLAPRMFSFNSPYGACQNCYGLGYRMHMDPELVVPDLDKSLSEGAIVPWQLTDVPYLNTNRRILQALVERYKFNPDLPFKKLPQKIKKILLYGTEGELFEVVTWENGQKKKMLEAFDGVIPLLEKRYLETKSSYLKGELAHFMNEMECLDCQGQRLRPESLAVTVAGKSIVDVIAFSIQECLPFFKELKLTEKETKIAEEVLKEIHERLTFLLHVGLGYLTLDRQSSTLSGGEAQRIRLATQIGSRLVGVLYILDEPSIGLHQKDNEKLLNALQELRDFGNTVVVVEHDPATIKRAHHIIDLGPGAGALGGEVVAEGSYSDILAAPRSLTGKYLTGELKVPVPKRRRSVIPTYSLVVKGARANNLKDLTVPFPLGTFICITGVSGSGKSTLIDEVLCRSLKRKFYHAKGRPGEHDEIIGEDLIDKVVVINQTPIGRSPRSNPATYTGLFSYVRELFAKMTEAKIRGYDVGRFSFNSKGGRCESCKGDGILKIEMHFLPDVYVPCEVCKGARYNRETLEVYYKGKNISDVLNMTVEEAVEHFKAIPRIHERLVALKTVGLGYIKLGQPATTISGGEAQRVKLASELCKRGTGKTFYILDEPTTGLHFADVHCLVDVLQKLVDQANTVVVIEHNLDVIKQADFVIDLGPQGGDLGGEVVAAGTPEEISKVPQSFTGQYLRDVLN